MKLTDSSNTVMDDDEEEEQEAEEEMGEEMILQEGDLNMMMKSPASLATMMNGESKPHHHHLNDDDDINIIRMIDPNDNTANASVTLLKLEDAITAASQHKEEGNALHARQKFRLAMVAYQKGLDALAQCGNDHNNGNSSNSNSSKALWDLHISLRSNLALGSLKLNEYDQAEKHCSVVLETWDDTVAKIWYRRAIARESLASKLDNNNNNNNNKSKSGSLGNVTNQDRYEYLQMAVEDLQKCIQLMEEQGQDAQMKRQATNALERIQNRLNTPVLPQTTNSFTAGAAATTSTSSRPNSPMVVSPPTSPEPATSNGQHNGHYSHSSTIIRPTTTSASAVPISSNSNIPPRPTPAPAQQRQDIMRLLIARSVSLGKQAATSTNPAAVGEAFFLVDWKWWCQWCRHVDFYHTNNATTTNDNHDKADRILKMLPPGAILPPPPSATNKSTKHKRNQRDDASSSTDSSDSEEDDDDDHLTYHQPPGMIDNTDLLLPSQTTQLGFRTTTADSHNYNSQTQPSFYKQWYRHFQPTEVPPSSPEDMDNDNDNDNNNNSARANGCLRPNLVRGFHYEILPREVYCALKSWYQEVTPSICRRTKLVVPTSSDNSNNNNNNNNNKNDDNADQNGKPQKPTFSLTLYPISFPKPKQQDGNTAPASTSTTDACAACRARYASKRCTRCMSVSYCDRGCQESHWPFHKATCSKLAAGKENPDHFVGDGRVGLNQLGNTCFMNCALQCLSHATPLTRHFLSNKFKFDLNASNPLGTGGKLALSYEAVLKELWMKPNITNTSPTALKRAIALFAPRFAGCLQHDSQEFLAYLLDGLHEDLNRIKKPPYVEMPDADDHGANKAVAGAEAWECHLQRNDSLVMDTFYGQFKSTCVCPNSNCGRVSVSFDAFNHVSLEIPQMQKSTIWIRVMVFYNPPATHQMNSKDPKNQPRIVRYAICVRRGSLIVDLRQALSQLCGIPTTHLVLCEVSEHAITQILHDNKPVTAIRPGETITAYQVDPYTDSSIHVVVTHALVEPGIKTGEDDEDEEPKTQPDFRQLFGYPFLTSCDAALTCRQLFDHLWRLVRGIVVPLTETGEEEDFDPELEEVYRQLFSVRVTDEEGNSVPVFPDSDQSKCQTDNEETDEAMPPQHSTYVPRNVDEKVTKFLGEDCTTKFLFLSIDWKESLVVPTDLVKKSSGATSSNAGGNNKKKKKSKKTNKTKEIPKVVRIEEQRFYSFTDHPSFMEGVRKERVMNAAKGVSLDQCFETFTKPERLDEHNMWYCSNCKEHVRALKTMELWRLPNILVVHLKRFEFRHGFRRDKLGTFVDFPLDGLDMSQHCAKWSNANDCSIDAGPPEQLRIDDNVPAVYDLFGVCNHYGRMGFGHYTAFARKWDEEELSPDWYLFDDASVRSVGDGRGGSSGVDSVASPAAYVLFYRRRAFN